MQSTTIKKVTPGEVLAVPKGGTRDVSLPRRQPVPLVRALAVVSSPDFGGHLMQSHTVRQRRIASELETKLRAFMELMANKD